MTDFVNGHPGGDKILMAAGGTVGPFWALYSQHFTPEVMEILETLRIGNLDLRDIEEPREVILLFPLKHFALPMLFVNVVSFSRLTLLILFQLILHDIPL